MNLVMDTNKKVRVDWIDTLKLVGMFYIYLGHFGKDAGLLYPFVFSFHVPLFFFISGLFYTHPNTLSALIIAIKKSFFSIVAPYFIFGLASLVFFTLRYQWGIADVTDKFTGLINGVRNNIFAESLWFLPCLFVVIIYHSTLLLLIKNKFSVLFISILIYSLLMPKAIISHPSYFFNIDSAACYLVYYSIGACLSEKLKFSDISETSGMFKFITTITILLSSLIFIVSYFKGYEIFFRFIELPQLRVTLALVVTCLLFVPSMALAYLINSNLLSSMGKYTIVFCGTEQILKLTIVSLISMVGLKLSFTNPMQPILLSVACLFISYFTLCKIYSLLKNK